MKPSVEKKRRPLSHWERLAVVAMDSNDYLRRQKVPKQLVRFRTERKPYVRVVYHRGWYIIAVPPEVANILAKKGIRCDVSYSRKTGIGSNDD